jgi:uncharacterized protein
MDGAATSRFALSAVVILLVIALVAFAYALVGHGGASGYLAVMAILSFSPAIMKPTALLLNLSVSVIAFVQFQRAGCFRWRLFWPFAVTSIPFAFLGGKVDLDPLVYERVLAVCLVIAALRLFGLFGASDRHIADPPIAMGLFVGAIIGLLAGMLGIGGGVLLSPLLLVCAWADAKSAAAVASLFIFVNSAAGLMGMNVDIASLDQGLLTWVLAAMVGGILGSWVGARRAPEPRLRQALGVVLLLASLKLLWS